MAPQITRSDASQAPGRVNYPASPFRLFEDFFNDWAVRNWQGGESWTPQVDILERDGSIQLRVSLPGMSEKDVELKIEGQVRGERKSQDPASQADRSSAPKPRAFCNYLPRRLVPDKWPSSRRFVIGITILGFPANQSNNGK